MDDVTVRVIESPLGPLRVAVDEGGVLRELTFARGDQSGDGAAGSAPGADEDACATVIRQLREYFAGVRSSFDLTVDPGGDGFRRRVWDAIREVPYGETVSYGELARLAGAPGAARAAGAACGANPIAVVIPCHRVVGAGGSLTGYGGGIENKRWLLAHERNGRAPESTA